MASKKKAAAPKRAAPTNGSKQKTPGEKAALRRKLFIEGMLSNNDNITKAALAAGFSPKTAASQGSRLLKNVEVQQELQHRRGALIQKLELTTENVIRSLACAVHFDPRKLYRADGTLKPIPELDDDTAQALSGFEVVEATGGNDFPVFTKKVKWLDKNAAREQAMRHLGLYEKDNRQFGQAFAERLVKARERAGKA